MRDQHYTVISIDTEKISDKIQNSFCKKTLKQGIEGNYFNLIKVIYEKATANIILNSEKLEVFPLSLPQGKGAHPHYFYSV